MTGVLLFNAWQCPTFTWDLPHYHRRKVVSLLSSGWIQVVPTRYCRQTNWLEKGMSYLIPFFRIRKVEFLELCTYIQLAKTFECYMVKPHGQLVQVSFTHY